MPELGLYPVDFDDVLFSGELHEHEFEFGILRIEHAQQCGYGIGADGLNGDFRLFLQLLVGIHKSKTVCGVLIAPIAQWLALINGLTRLAQEQPRGKAHDGDEERDEQDSPFVRHVHFTPAWAAASGSIFLRAEAAQAFASEDGSARALINSGTADFASLPKAF